jgi:alpha-galactosidase
VIVDGRLTGVAADLDIALEVDGGQGIADVDVTVEVGVAPHLQGHEVAGFVWWQGHKEGNPAHASRYEQNLVRLIKTLRQEFDAPTAPFVLGTIGFGGWEMQGPHLTVANAQLAVSGEKGKYPEFKGNVLTVETRDFWRTVEQSPRNQGYHYNRNAETYMLVGEALGRGMVELIEQKK